MRASSSKSSSFRKKTRTRTGRCDTCGIFKVTDVRHSEVRAMSAFTRVFVALWRASKDDADMRSTARPWTEVTPGHPSRRAFGAHLRGCEGLAVWLWHGSLKCDSVGH